MYAKTRIFIKCPLCKEETIVDRWKQTAEEKIRQDSKKFRAWDKKTKQMYEVISINIKGDSLILKTPTGEIACPFDDVELMRCTGLKGRKGQLGYARDICISKYSRNSLVCFEITSIDIAYNHLADSVIIGNIYENPDITYCIDRQYP